jgi:hypothetical protein
MTDEPFYAPNAKPLPPREPQPGARNHLLIALAFRRVVTICVVADGRL